MLDGRSTGAATRTPILVGTHLVASLRASGVTPPTPVDWVDGLRDDDGHPERRPGCPVLSWASSGAMWLTGWPDGPPQWPTGDVLGVLGGVAALFTGLARSVGADPGPLDLGELLTGRAAARGGVRRGAISVGGGSRILRAADGWLAVTLSRPGDVELLPAMAALAGADGVAGEPVPGKVGPDEETWARTEAFTRSRRAGELMEAAQAVGLPASEVAIQPSVDRPWSISRVGEPAVPGRRTLRVVDLSAMWAGPLCAHLLGRCGAEVVNVEDANRPDAARLGDPWLYGHLHAGHERVALEFSSEAGRRVLADLVDQADVVIEASRPRALGHLGLGPEPFLGSRAGRTWVAITARGRSGRRANWVGFGDDAAAGGGLVAGGDPSGPAFCADAIADPVAGLCAATGALASIAAGGGHLVDCSMVVASAFVNGVGGCTAAHPTERRGGEWFVAHGQRVGRVERPRLPA